MNDELLTAADLAKQLNVHVRTLHRLRVRGEGPPAYRVGHAYRYQQREVEAWLRARASVQSVPVDAGEVIAG